MNKFPWEFTAEEFLGPRWKISFLDEAHAAAGRSRFSAEAPKAPRERVRDFEVEYTPNGVLVFDSEGKIAGTLCHGKTWSVSKGLRSIGLVSEIDAEYRTRYGTSPEMFLEERMSSLTPEAERLVRRVHAICVQRAVERNVEVDHKVLESVVGAEERFAALRAGDDSALEQLSDKERRRMRSRGAGRYRWVAVSKGTIEWVRGSVSRSSLKSFESLVVVV